MARKKGETDYRILIYYSEYESLIKQSEELKKHHAKVALQLQADVQPKSLQPKAVPNETNLSTESDKKVNDEKKINNEDEQSGSGVSYHHRSGFSHDHQCALVIIINAHRGKIIIIAPLNFDPLFIIFKKHCIPPSPQNFNLCAFMFTIKI